ncbi:MAG TPA: hypothetical protein VMG10_11645 [Gemmataceae bacterium]|nr:hypothetical protein [Gemmataceae bacterium]
MKLVIRKKTFPVGDITLRLIHGHQAEVAIDFAAGAGSPSRSLLADWSQSEQRGALEGDGIRVSFDACGFTDGEKVQLLGRVAPRGLTAWFKARRHPLTVYQWQGVDQAPDAWSFLNAALDGKFARPPQNLAAACAGAFPLGAAFCRPAGIDNLSFLKQLLALLALRVPNVAGFYGVGDPAQPLRLIGPLADTKLDDEWEPLPPWRDDGPAWISGKLRRAIRVKRPVALLEALAVRGRPCEAGQLERAADRAQVVAGPGLLRKGPAQLFCTEAAYHFPGDQRSAVTAELAFAAPPPLGEPPPAIPLDGQFEAWLAADAVLAALNPVGWKVAGAARLHAELLLPVVASDGEVGFYVKRRQGQPLRILCLPGEVPSTQGAAQRQNAALECHDMTLNAGLLRVKARKANFTGSVNVAKNLNVAEPGEKEN